MLVKMEENTSIRKKGGENDEYLKMGKNNIKCFIGKVRFWWLRSKFVKYPLEAVIMNGKVYIHRNGKFVEHPKRWYHIFG